MKDEVNKKYIDYYIRLHQEIREAFVSLYYLKAIDEANVVDEHISFKNEFLYYITENMKEKLCSQIFKLILDDKKDNRKTIKKFIEFLTENSLVNIPEIYKGKDFITQFISKELESKIIRMRHSNIGHIGTDELKNIEIEIKEMEIVLLKISSFFNSLFIREIIPLNDTFTEFYLSKLREKCKVAVLCSLKSK